MTTRSIPRPTPPEDVPIDFSPDFDLDPVQAPALPTPAAAAALSVYVVAGWKPGLPHRVELGRAADLRQAQAIVSHALSEGFQSIDLFATTAAPTA